MKRFIYLTLITLLIGIFVAEPIVSYAQTAAVADLTALKALTGELKGEVVLSATEKKLWADLLDSQGLDEKDKRLTNYVLPQLAKEFGQIHVDILKDYATEDQQQSRLLATSTGVSQRFFAKAASLTSLGTMSCTDPSILFARELNPAKPVWLNKQAASPNLTPFFGRSFDAVARQSLLLSARAFTNRPVSAQTWNSLLQQIAKGEIEERFDLQSGLLANTPNGDLAKTIAAGRLARQLGLSHLPNFGTSTSFYALVGQNEVEQTLDLPSNSFVSHNDTKFWYETYQNIGFRVLEEQLELPDTNTTVPPFPSPGNLIDQPRFQLLTKRLNDRGSLYVDPVLALGLPSEGYLPTNSGSNIYERLKNGDPDAFAAVGAYFLADSLQLTAAELALFVQAVSKGENRALSLATARPLDSNLKATQLFGGEMTTNQREALLESIGQTKKESLAKQLNQINGNVLRALTNAAQAPNEDSIVALFKSQSSLDGVVTKLAASSQADADYPDGLTAAALQRRGEELLGQALSISPTDLARLSEATDSAMTSAIAQKVDAAFGWPSLGGQPLSRLWATGQLTDQQMLLAGINQLWNRLDLPPTIQSDLNALYLGTAVAPTETSGDEEVVTTDEPTTAATATPAADSGDEITDDQTTDEVVAFAIPSNALSLTESLTIATGIDATNQIPLLTGRFRTGIKILTLSAMAKVLSNGSTITIPRLLDLYSQASTEGAEAITAQANALYDNGYMSQDFFEGLKKAADADQPDQVWPILETELIRQWNFGCPHQQEEAQNSIDRLVELALSWPETTNEPTQEATRPVQIFTFDREALAQDVKSMITEKYPTKAGSKTGVFSNDRNWDDIYIGL